MKVLVNVHGLQFVIPCGEGAQTFKWLGLVVAQRYALEAPHGRCRTREDVHLKQGFFLPSAVLTANGELLPPGKRISEGVKDNERLTVQLQQEVPVNEIGAPQFSSWATSAFSSQRPATDNHPLFANAEAKTSPYTMHSSASTTTPTIYKADAKRAAIMTSTVDEEMKEYARSEMLQQVNSVHFQSEMELEAAFLYDWSRLKIDEVERDAKERDAIQEMLQTNFAAINAAYMHYAVGSGEMTYGMNGYELAHFVHECAIGVHFQKDKRILEKVFSQCLKHAAFVSPFDRGTLTRAGFLHALIRTILVSSSNTPLKESLEMHLKENIVPSVGRLTRGPFRDHSHHDTIVAVYQDAKPKLTKLYTRYALEHSSKEDESTTPSSSSWPLLLSASGLKAMLYDCGMFYTGDTTTHDDIFDKAITQCFSGMREFEHPHDQRVVFAEFLEVVSRVALAVLDENDIPPKDAIKIALDALRSLPTIKEASTTTTTGKSLRK